MAASSVVNGFRDLSPPVRAALADRGFAEPTAPQRRAIPGVAAGEHVLVVAPTGTGKTEAAALPILDRLRENPPEGMGALYVTPLRALNRDMRDRLETWGDRFDLDVQVRHGDTGDYQRRKQATDPPDLLVTTPETVQAMLTGDRLREGLADLRHVVVDEVHELAASKRGAQLSIGLERLGELAGPIQRVGLSATVGDPDRMASFLTAGRECHVAQVEAASRLDVTVRRPRVTEADEERAAARAADASFTSHVRTIAEEIASHESTLVFVNTRGTTEALGAALRDRDVAAAVHHGSLARDARIEAEDRFKRGEIDALVCTSSMELGVDVGRIDHVVQYRSPREVRRLLQRVGRAGHRADAVSSGTIIATDPDDVLEATAIVERALDGQVETTAIHDGALDVVANQVAGLASGHGEIDAARAYEVVTRAHPFQELDRSTFRELLRECRRNRILWVDEDADRIESGGRTWQYVYQTLSMIPDEQTYAVHDVAAGRQIGTLDERFVRDFAETGETFVQGGDLWRIASVDHEDCEVTVSPVEDPQSEVPAWIGQEIPVPEAVAGEVGSLRERIANAVAEVDDGGDTDPPSDIVDDDRHAAAAGRVAGSLSVDDRTIAPAVEQVAAQTESDHPVPTAGVLLAEADGRTVTLNATYGHQVNETLGRLIAALLGQRTGSSVGLDAGPYRIELEVPRGVGPAAVLEVLESTEPDHVEPLLELGLADSGTLAVRLAQVAKRFGAVEPDGDGLPPRRLLAMLEDSLAHEEALRETEHEELAVDAATRIVERIQSGAIETAIVGEPTPVGQGSGADGYEFVTAGEPDAAIVETVRERLHDDEVRLLCVACGEWECTRRVGAVADQPRCPQCEATRVAALNPWDEETPGAVRTAHGQKDVDAKRLTRKAHRAANIVQEHGKRAVIALAARGVGPQTAARVLGNLRDDELDFYRDLLEAEREYARTRSFWD
jgi:ATP-dependent Lhr-like helicase